MYFPCGRPQIFSCDNAEGLCQVAYSEDKSLFAVIGIRDLYLWVEKPRSVVASITRSTKSLLQHGENVSVHFKPDSSQLAVVTDKNYIFTYSGMGKSSNAPAWKVLEFQFPYERPYVKGPGEGQGIPGHTLRHQDTFYIESGICSLLPQGDLLCILTAAGSLQCIGWDGVLNEEESLFLSDIEVSGASISHDICGRDLCYNRMFETYVAVLSSGSVLQFTSKRAQKRKFEKRFRKENSTVATESNKRTTTLTNSSVVSSGAFTSNVNDATCIAFSGKFNFVAIGCKSGDVKVFTCNKDSLTLNMSHALCLKTNNALYDNLGAVACLNWSYDASAIAVGYEGRGYSAWSTFGRLLYCSALDHYVLNDIKDHRTVARFPYESCGVQSLDWGPEGFNIMVIFKKKAPIKQKRISFEGDKVKSKKTVPQMDMPGGQIFQFSFVKSAQGTNPVASNQQGCVLYGTDNLFYYFPEDDWIQGDQESQCDVPWTLIKITNTYLVDNWPIKFVVVDDKRQSIAVSGKRGFAIFSIPRQRWKIFGNQAHEREFQVRGGFIWYGKYLIVPCRTINTLDQIRMYDCSASLDNSQMISKFDFDCSIILANIYNNHVCVFTTDRRLHFFLIHESSSGPTLKHNQTISMTSIFPFPSFTTFISLSKLSYNPADDDQSDADIDEPKSLIINSDGILKLIELDGSLTDPYQDLKFGNVATITDGVENVFLSDVIPPGRYSSDDESDQAGGDDDTGDETGEDTGDDEIAAEDSLITGGKKKKVKRYTGFGLAGSILISSRMENTMLWLSMKTETGPKRFMIAFQLNVNPLAVNFSQGLVLGMVTEASFDIAYRHHSFPHLLFEHKTQLYLSHVYKHLLRRSRDSSVALNLTKECRQLSFFTHSLELLLHDVLEDEVDSKLADPLLPKVIDFLRPFPQFLEVVAHCARKSEVAGWEFLFGRIGDPKELFELCLEDRRIHTAASYLVILQNLEPIEVSRQYAARLLDAALNNDQWKLANDLIRFISAIAEETNANRQNRRNSQSFNSVEVIAIDEQKGSRTVSTQTNVIEDSEKFYVDVLLSRCARKLISEHRLKALANFSLHLQFPLQLWLRKERKRAAKVDNYVEAFSSLIKQFHSIYGEDELVKEQKARKKSYDDTLWVTSCGDFESLATQGNEGKRVKKLTASETALKVADERAIATQELRHLLDLCLVSRCYDWAILMSVFLRSSDQLLCSIYFAKHDATLPDGEASIRKKLKPLYNAYYPSRWTDFLKKLLDIDSHRSESMKSGSLSSSASSLQSVKNTNNQLHHDSDEVLLSETV